MAEEKQYRVLHMFPVEVRDEDGAARKVILNNDNVGTFIGRLSKAEVTRRVKAGYLAEVGVEPATVAGPDPEAETRPARAKSRDK